MLTHSSQSIGPKLTTPVLFCWLRKLRDYVRTQGRRAQRMKARLEECVFVCACRVGEMGTDAPMRRFGIPRFGTYVSSEGQNAQWGPYL